MYALYTLGLCVAGVLLFPRLLRRAWWGAEKGDWRERLGLLPPAPALAGCLWFHAASVGEVQALAPIVAALHQRLPQRPVVVSTFTPSGKRLARQAIPQAALVFLLPVDVPWTLKRVLARLQPRALLVQETELWPQLFRLARRRQVPVVLLNGRLSPRAFRRYRYLRPLLRRVLHDVRLLLVQSDTMAQRFRELGTPPARLRVTGNTNIDRALLAAAAPAAPHPLAPLLSGRRVFVAGSTHAGEEELLLQVYRRLQATYPDLLLVLAPRHLERVARVVRLGRAAGCPVVRRSQCAGLRPADLGQPCVLVLDTLGELAALYRLASVAFVGGSLVPVGGHNLLEPAVFAKPLFFGPYLHHFPDLAAMLCAAGGAVQVPDAAALHAEIDSVLRHPERGIAMGQRALQALKQNRGALERTVAAVAAVLAEVGEEACA
ncbi:MAG: 3-deoxy-D-manno-octulosonic acid transferase [Candidatus Tectimicrobiota bacterium]|nr:MAG: 3-deoxy-D-manno-octulosonic acid transferase [Candidatus Tectomicrobia bacterium]